MRQLYITKSERSLLKNASGFLLKNATILSQIATVHTALHWVLLSCLGWCSLMLLGYVG